MSSIHYRLAHGKFKREYGGYQYWVSVGIRENDNNSPAGRGALNINHIVDMITWADSMKLNYTSNPMGKPFRPLFLFKLESDMMLFVLRWDRTSVSEEALLE